MLIGCVFQMEGDIRSSSSEVSDSSENAALRPVLNGTPAKQLTPANSGSETSRKRDAKSSAS